MSDIDDTALAAAGVDHVPPTLAKRDRWMVWNYDEGRKVPRAPWDRPLKYGANTQDPSLWVDLGTALDHAAKDDVDGVAYVLASSDPDHEHAGVLPEPDHVLVDFDKVRDPETGDHHPIMDRVLENVGTYAQISTSGTGYHIIGEGRLPEDVTAVDRGLSSYHGFTESNVEIYDNGRYIAFTGRHLDGTPEDTGNAQALVNEIADAASDPADDDDSHREERTPRKSREDLADVDTTHEMDDVLDAIDHVHPSDIRLRSDVTVNRSDGTADLDPSWASSESGTRLAQLDDGWVYRQGMIGLDALQVVALEERIITDESDYPSGDAWWKAVDALRERGAHIPEYVPGDLPEEAVEERGRLTDEDEWEIFAKARADGTLDETAEITAGALRHIAREHGLYDFDALSEDVLDLPVKAHNRALWWVEERWPEEADLRLDDDEQVTSRPYRERDPERVFTWEDVRYVFDSSTEDGRHAAETLLRDRYHFMTVDKTDVLHVYDADTGVYRDRLAPLKGEIKDGLGKEWSTHTLNEILEALKQKPRVEPRELNGRQQFEDPHVCVANGVLNLFTRDLEPHSPDYYFVDRVPQVYDSDADPSTYEEYLDDWTEREEDAKAMMEMVGHALVPDANERYKKFLILTGGADNGKSMFFTAVNALLNGPDGEESNVANVKLEKMSSNRFSKNAMYGYMANIAGEIDGKKIRNTAEIKDITGGDQMEIEPKGSDSYFDVMNTTLMFAANDPPIIGERDKQAIATRIVPIELPYTFVNEPEGPMEKQKLPERVVEEDLFAPEALSGFLTLALEGIERLEENYGDVSLPESPRERLDTYERRADPMREFGHRCLCNRDGDYVVKADITTIYQEWAVANGYELGSNYHDPLHAALRGMRDLNYTTSRPRAPDYVDTSLPLRPWDDRQRVVSRVSLTDEGLEYAEAAGLVLKPEDESEEADVTPLSQLSNEGIPYVDVAVRVKMWDVGPDGGPAEKGTVADSTATLDLVDWFGCDLGLKDSPEEGECYLLEDVRVGTYDGALQLEIVQGTTKATPVERGFGYIEAADPGEGQGQLGDSDAQTADAASDGGTPDAGAEEDVREENASERSETAVPEDAEGALADAQRLVELLEQRGIALEENEIVVEASMNRDLMPPTRVKEILEYAVKEKGLIMETDEGYRPV